MLEDIRKTLKEALNELSQAASTDALENFKLKYLVKKGRIQGFFNRLKDVLPQDKPLVGKELNELRRTVQEKFNEKLESLTAKADSTPEIDLTLPGRRGAVGTRHPVLKVLDEMKEIFVKMGFSIAEGPDIEDDFHNFDALNFPPDHPARDMQDTFFLKSGKDLLLRTHTSPVQIRVMRSMKPPIRAIMPGRVYRNEAINARSLAEFHQVEGLYIDRNVSFAELKGTVVNFARKMYGENIEFRFRPSFFPFTEPSAEMDITCFLCGGSGCRVCKQTGWLEIVGCGMVHPNVIKSGGIDPEEYSGYAFGFGIERVAMLRTGVDDIRLFYENDVRVLNQL